MNPLMSLGDIRVKRGDLTGADSLYSIALSILQERFGTRSRLYDYLYPRMAVLRDLQHRPTDATALWSKTRAKSVRPLAYY